MDEVRADIRGVGVTEGRYRGHGMETITPSFSFLYDVKGLYNVCLYRSSSAVFCEKLVINVFSCLLIFL